MAQVKYIVRILFIIVVILFVDSVNRSFKTQEKHDHAEEHHMHGRDMDSYLHAKLFQAQRNMYLTGSVIFLSLVLNRFFNLIGELAKNEEKTEVLKQQAAKTTKEYLKLLDKEQKSSSTGSSSSSSLQKELDEKKAECDRLAKELEIVKKQANQSHDAYMKLTDQYNALEKGSKGSDKKSD